MTPNLSLASLAKLHPDVARPSYRREQVSPGIVHIGTGNFHRAHQAVYLDDLFNAGRDHDWGIIGAGFRPPDAAMRTALEGQDWLTTVVERDVDRTAARVTGAMIDFLPVGPDRRPLVSALSNPNIRIVSLTVTEGGYCIDPATGAFDPDHPDIKADVANPMQPMHVFGTLVAALRARREAGVRQRQARCRDGEAAHEGEPEAGAFDEPRREGVEAAGHDEEPRIGEQTAQLLRRRRHARSCSTSAPQPPSKPASSPDSSGSSTWNTAPLPGAE